ncbi:TnsD family Tn7-like transposition protein [Roseateles sp. BYS78W]|uniref:TnsD family Tn7-like transposition protein n=1 Tax=Pelomonas candidula TaxID=3299025 RepID=A0ABW7HDI0_9BURK
MWGHRLAGQTAQLFFGHKGLGHQHDFAGGLNHLVQATGGRLGDVGSISLERTLLRYYHPFLTESREQDCVSAMGGPSVAHLKFRLGLLTSRFRAHHPLKTCLACIEEDRDQTGWVWWRMDHQYPGVWVCPRHGEYLMESSTKSNGVSRFQWVLPDPRLCCTPTLIAPRDTEVRASLARFALLVGEVVDRRPTIRLDSETLQHHYRNTLSERGLMLASGRIALTAAAGAFLQHVRPLRAVLELAALPENIDQAKAQLARLLAPLRSGTHPLRHLVMIDWLIGASSDLFARLAAPVVPSAPAFGEAQTCIAGASLPSSRRTEVMASIRDGTMSMRAAARALDVDTQTVMVWAAQIGIEAGRRPKLLKNDVRPKLITALQQGASKADAASRWKVSVTTVTTLLRTVPGLHERWREAKLDAARTTSRRRWTELLASDQAMDLKRARAKEPAIYAWLYRNDRAWLDQHKPHRLRRGAISQVDWLARDLELSTAVEQAVKVARTTWGDQPLRTWHLIQAMPELRPKLRHLGRLPLTRQAIAAATCHGSADSGPDS